MKDTMPSMPGVMGAMVPKITYSPRRTTIGKSAVDAQKLKLVAMNRDGLGTEIRRDTLHVALPITHQPRIKTKVTP